jgi:hypothetical protein
MAESNSSRDDDVVVQFLKASGPAQGEADMSIISTVPGAAAPGEQGAAELLPLVYDDLRRLAARRLAREAPGQILDPTSLIHEAYLRLVGTGQGTHWDSKDHFFAAAAVAMRRILVENAQPEHDGT